MSKLLAAVTRAANRRTAAEHSYRAAIQAARDAGHTLPDIGRAAGLTKQGVWFLLNPDRRKEQT